MSIDWFTVGAQALNLLVLLWLMKRFLYKPVLKAIDEREKRIAAELASAAADKTAAQEEKAAYDKKNADIHRESAALLKNAQEEVQSVKLQLLKEAKKDADAFREKRQKVLMVEEAALRTALGKKIQDESLALARKILTDLAGASLEEQMIRAFVQRLHDMEQQQKEDLVSALKKESDTLTLHTAFAVPTKLGTDTEKAIREIFGPQVTVVFKSSPEVISGIEVTVQGQKIAWSVDDYLSSMADEFEKILKEQVQ